VEAMAMTMTKNYCFIWCSTWYEYYYLF
jgi:hypothetical protein